MSIMYESPKLKNYLTYLSWTFNILHQLFRCEDDFDALSDIQLIVGVNLVHLDDSPGVPFIPGCWNYGIELRGWISHLEEKDHFISKVWRGLYLLLLYFKRQKQSSVFLCMKISTYALLYHIFARHDSNKKNI